MNTINMIGTSGLVRIVDYTQGGSREMDWVASHPLREAQTLLVAITLLSLIFASLNIRDFRDFKNIAKFKTR